MMSYNLDLESLGSVKKQVFFKRGSLENFAIITGKHLCWGLFLMRLQAIKFATILKGDSSTGVSCGYSKFLRTTFFIEHLHCLPVSVLQQCSKVRQGVWFCGSMCYQFWLKTYKKSCTSNSLLLCDNTISSLFELIHHVLLISDYV